VNASKQGKNVGERGRFSKGGGNVSHGGGKAYNHRGLERMLGDLTGFALWSLLKTEPALPREKDLGNSGGQGGKAAFRGKKKVSLEILSSFGYCKWGEYNL